MSKNISIAEGGVARQFTVDEVDTPKVGGGMQPFVPKDEVRLTTKHISKNGTYPAASDGYYGFKSVTVNVPGGSGSADSHGKPSGTIPPGDIGSAVIGEDEDGNDAVIGVDKDGKLVKTPIPTTIVLVTPPTKTEYNDGESIDLSGAVVTAKMADGTTWTDADHPSGHVSCTCDPGTADASQAGGFPGSASAFDFGDYITQPIYYTESVVSGHGQDKEDDAQATGFDRSADTTYFPSGTKLTFLRYQEDNLAFGFVVGSADENAVMSYHNILRRQNTGEVLSEKTVEVPLSSSFTYDGKTVYWTYQRPIYVACAEPYQDVVGQPGEKSKWIAWTMVYGTVTPGGTQTITLNWARPGDGKVLSTTMEINVGAHSTESSSGTEGSGGGGRF